MKKTLLLIFVLFSVQFTDCFSQSIEINPFGGYVFPTRFNMSHGYARIVGNANYGANVSLNLKRNFNIEVGYNRQDTKVELNSSQVPYQVLPISMNYWTFCSYKDFQVTDVFDPYIGLGVGGLLIYPKQDYNSFWLFNISAKGGVKIFMNKRVGVKLEACLQMPIEGMGLNFYFSPGGGSGTGVDFNSTTVQFGFNGGLVFRLGRDID
jgi:opacity protein-like surface antigen